jgi:cell wall-associated NlpC family hydrolase
MVFPSSEQMPPSTQGSGQIEFICQRPLNLYKTAVLTGLVTQAAAGRHLVCAEAFASTARNSGGVADGSAASVRLCEDDYPGWISHADRAHLVPAPTPYQPVRLDRDAIAARLPAVLDFAQTAMVQPNVYLWGGTVGPDFDCSGLMQTAFASAGIRLPRDSYQQEAFTQPIDGSELLPGDLIFFGTPERTTHVALYLGNGDYIHSSGREQGRNGIGIDSLTDLSHPVSQTYHRQLRRAGRVMASYCPGEQTW